MFELQELSESIIKWGTLIFVFVAALTIVAVVVIYFIDKYQTTQTVRRNYPVIGRFRYFFEHAGEFFRQYFFSMDREEMPFNRAERNWVYRAAKKVDTTIAFGSTRPLNIKGEPIFVHDAFPVLEHKNTKAEIIVLGENYCRVPYATSAIINISGMSFGAISKPAVLALSQGAKKAGIWMNTGEGGLSPMHLKGGADIVFQIGTAKYGVRDKAGNLCDSKLKAIAAHSQVKMFEIKMSQGAKPGKGGILPGAKVTKEIALIRGIEEGQASISPNGHLDIKSTSDLLDMIGHVRTITGKPVGFKIAVGRLEFFHDLFKKIHERGIASAPDFITLDSADGGTGAAPQPLIDSVGLTLLESLPLVVNILHEYGLRERIRIVSSGKLMTPTKAAWALAAGSDFITSARGFMFSLGCIQALQCNKNTCPTGITTHDKKLQRGLVPANKAVRVTNFANELVDSMSVIAHSCGVNSPRELNRTHVRIIEYSGHSEELIKMHPIPEIKAEYRT